MHLLEYFSVNHFSFLVVNSIASILLDDPLKILKFIPILNMRLVEFFCAPNFIWRHDAS